MSGVIGVGYSASINNPDYFLEEDKSINQIQITARNEGTSGLCVLTQNESGNQYFRTKTTGLGSYTLTKVSTPPVSNDTPILSSRFNPTKKYPLDLDFYWV